MPKPLKFEHLCKKTAFWRIFFLHKWYATYHYHRTNMKIALKQIKTTALIFSLGFLFLLGTSPLCQAQGVIASGIADTWSAGNEFSYGISDETVFVSYPVSIATESVGSPVISDPLQSYSPAVVPEASTLGLFLAGSATLLRFGRSKRSI